MPRKYYRRTRVVRPKKKWASNLVLVNGTGSGNAYVSELCSNAAPNSTPTPIILKAGNFKVRVDSQVTFGGSAVEWWPSLSFYVVYMPDGMSLGSNPSASDVLSYVTRHPEWILCSTVVGSNTVTAAKFDLDTAVFSSRLKRNLNSGDKIMLLCSGTDTTIAYSGVVLRGVIKFWTCTN